MANTLSNTCTYAPLNFLVHPSNISMIPFKKYILQTFVRSIKTLSQKRNFESLANRGKLYLNCV